MVFRNLADRVRPRQQLKLMTIAHFGTTRLQKALGEMLVVNKTITEISVEDNPRISNTGTTGSAPFFLVYGERGVVAARDDPELQARWQFRTQLRA